MCEYVWQTNDVAKEFQVGKCFIWWPSGSLADPVEALRRPRSLQAGLAMFNDLRPRSTEMYDQLFNNNKITFCPECICGWCILIRINDYFLVRHFCFRDVSGECCLPICRWSIVLIRISYYYFFNSKVSGDGYYGTLNLLKIGYSANPETAGLTRMSGVFRVSS